MKFTVMLSIAIMLGYFQPAFGQLDSFPPEGVVQPPLADAPQSGGSGLDFFGLHDPAGSCGAASGFPDFNADCALDMQDFLILAANFNDHGTFEQGDSNLDGVVDLSDFMQFRSSYLLSATSSTARHIPEPPGSVVGLVGGLMILMLRHARRGKSCAA